VKLGIAQFRLKTKIAFFLTDTSFTGIKELLLR
jgi:hypothetical protein